MANVTINMSEDELKELLDSKGIEYDTISEHAETTVYKEKIENAIELYEGNGMYKSLFKNKRNKTIKNRVNNLYKDAYNNWDDPFLELIEESEDLIGSLLPEE